MGGLTLLPILASNPWTQTILLPQPVAETTGVYYHAWPELPFLHGHGLFPLGLCVNVLFFYKDINPWI
jgi:hypothetical protein